jgi:pyrimidine operon attenuation protein/uracil phosphoribosyltransferase
VEITLDKDSNNLVASTNIPVSQCKNKTIILVDDVLNSGRTLLYGLSVFLNIPTKKIRTAVLVDRSHKLFPISTDYAGYTISTVSQEHISVVFDKNKDAVYLS